MRDFEKPLAWVGDFDRDGDGLTSLRGDVSWHHKEQSKLEACRVTGNRVAVR